MGVKVDSHTIQHIAFIPDGNRRWAKARHMPQLMGHKSGFELVQKMYDWCLDYKIKYVTFFLFSTENWNRSSEEVSGLFDLFRSMFSNVLEKAQKQKIRIMHIGNVEKLPSDVARLITELSEATKENNELTVITAISYSGHDEIVRAVKKISRDVAAGKITCDDIDEKSFENYLDTQNIPPPDILVRTGEQRISNFLLWQLAYSEIFFVNKLWPDFNREDLQNILDEYSHRKRKYGK